MDLVLRVAILIGIGLILKTATLIFVNRRVESSKKLYYYQISVGILLILGGSLLLKSGIMSV
ncbi:hypothetical protein HBP72_12380 [Listeria welshimeri]|nr:hypothetical protein [Listeria welshimeri]MBC2360700.1 hypothetical protein [Listeria welshimeri]